MSDFSGEYSQFLVRPFIYAARNLRLIIVRLTRFVHM